MVSTIVFEGLCEDRIRKEAHALQKAKPWCYIIEKGPITKSIADKINSVENALRNRSFEDCISKSNAFVICIHKNGFTDETIKKECEKSYQNVICVEDDMYAHVRICNAIDKVKLSILHPYNGVIQEVLSDEEASSFDVISSFQKEEKEKFDLLLIELLRNSKVWKDDLTIIREKEKTSSKFLVSCVGYDLVHIQAILETIRRYISRELLCKSWKVYLNAVL